MWRGRALADSEAVGSSRASLAIGASRKPYRSKLVAPHGPREPQNPRGMIG